MGVIHKIYTFFGGKEGTFLQKKWSEYCINKEKKKHIMHQQRLLQQYGIYMLDVFFDTCREFNIQGWIEFGTLLGAYRNKSFIPHDYDLDTGMYFDDYTDAFERKLIEKGFKKHSEFYLVDVKNGKKEKSEYCFEYKGMTLDIFLSKNIQGRRVSYSYFAPFEMGEEMKFLAERANFDLITHLEDIEINGHIYHCPNNPEIPLAQTYGDDFMIPNPNWVPYQETPYAHNHPKEEFYGIYKKYL